MYAVMQQPQIPHSIDTELGVGFFFFVARLLETLIPCVSKLSFCLVCPSLWLLRVHFSNFISDLRYNTQVHTEKCSQKNCIQMHCCGCLGMNLSSASAVQTVRMLFDGITFHQTLQNINETLCLIYSVNEKSNKHHELIKQFESAFN